MTDPVVEVFHEKTACSFEQSGEDFADILSKRFARWDGAGPRLRGENTACVGSLTRRTSPDSIQYTIR